MQLEIGEYVRILDVSRIMTGDKYWNNGDITEVTGHYESDKNQPQLRSTRSERYDMSLWISKDELEYVKKVTPLEARMWVIEQAREYVKSYHSDHIRFGLIGTTTEAFHGTRTAIAKCSPDDLYNIHIGKAIALARLLGKKVPTIFLHVPQVFVQGSESEAVYQETLAMKDPLEHSNTEYIMTQLPIEEVKAFTTAKIATTDDVTHPAHYHTGSIDVIKFAGENFSKEEIKGFFRISAIKYVTRYDKKGGLDDLEKAQDFINRLKELEG